MITAESCPHLDALAVPELNDSFAGTRAFWCPVCQRHFDLPAYGFVARVRRRLARALWVE